MRYALIFLAILCWLAIQGASARAVDYANADMAATGVLGELIGDRFVCSVTVKNIQDDAARDVNVVVVLPLEVMTVGQLPPGCGSITIQSGGATLTSHLMCKLGTLNVGQATGFKVETTASKHPRGNNCAAFVFNSMPDGVPLQQLQGIILRAQSLRVTQPQCGQPQEGHCFPLRSWLRARTQFLRRRLACPRPAPRRFSTDLSAPKNTRAAWRCHYLMARADTAPQTPLLTSFTTPRFSMSAYATSRGRRRRQTRLWS
jgi:hypothetical protein